VFQGGPEVVDGMVHLPETPGFGFTIDWKGVERYRA
jgi:L-alanine-DL-glutamate epimerase-like enolase superfamily enzyme